jgi:hypothetical protein
VKYCRYSRSEPVFNLDNFIKIYIRKSCTDYLEIELVFEEYTMLQSLFFISRTG